MNINNIKTPEDIYLYMERITYGWKDKYNNLQIDTLKNFRKFYITMSLEEVIENKVACCIEQAELISKLLDMIEIPNKKFCTRIYEKNDSNNLDEEEHMHCFVLYYMNDKVYLLEHANAYKKGIYEFISEEVALKKINDYYIDLVNGVSRPITCYDSIDAGLTFNQINEYMNNIDTQKVKKLV